MSSTTSPRTKAFIALHIAVLLWGFTAILGKLITYGSITLVWHRMMLTALIYLLMPPVWRSLKGLSLKTTFTFLGIGLLVCAHWLTFYGSIKLGNSVSVTLACLGSASFFASIIEPLVLKQTFSKRDICMGLIVVLGILFIYFSLPENQPDNVAKVDGVSYGWSVISGLLSAALAATFTTLNKANIHRAKPLAISTLEMISGALVLMIIAPMISTDAIVFLPSINFSILTLENIATGPWDLIWILLLAVLCTNLTFYLGTYALNQLSAFTANLTVNLEPIYGIVLGAVIFEENKNLNIWFYTGAAIILSAIFTQAYLSNRKPVPNV